jgi:F-type H+-transporting ATPase subunit alpha
LNQGRRIVEILKQPQNNPLPVEQQVLLFYAITRKHFTDIPVDQIQSTEVAFLKYMTERHDNILTQIRTNKKIDGLESALDDAIKAFKASLK